MASEEAKKAAQKEVEKRLAPMIRALNTVREVNDKGRQAVQAWADSKTRPAPAATDTGLVTVKALNEMAEEMERQIAAAKAEKYDENAFAELDLNFFLECAAAIRTPPIAPVEGLDTVETQSYSMGSWHTLTTCGIVAAQELDIKTRELVTRSQAEELLAAERTEKERWHKKAMDAGVIVHSDGTTSHPMRKERDDLKADNARKDYLLSVSDTVAQQLQNQIVTLTLQKEALEAKLAAAEKALEPFAEYCGDHFDKDYDGNPLPDEQKVGWVYLNYGHFRKARAVLGGKPS